MSSCIFEDLLRGIEDRRCIYRWFEWNTTSCIVDNIYAPGHPSATLATCTSKYTSHVHPLLYYSNLPTDQKCLQEGARKSNSSLFQAARHTPVNQKKGVSKLLNGKPVDTSWKGYTRRQKMGMLLLLHSWTN